MTHPLADEARALAAMIQLGEKIAWGRDSDMLNRMADAVDAATGDPGEYAQLIKRLNNAMLYLPDGDTTTLGEEAAAALTASEARRKRAEEEAADHRRVWNEDNDKIDALTARVAELEAALGPFACKCSSNCDWEGEDVCASWTASATLAGKDKA